MSLFSDFVPLFVFSFAYFRRDKITEQLLGTKSLNNYIVLGILLTDLITILYTFFGSQHHLSKT